MENIYKADTHTGNYYASRFFDVISEPKSVSFQQRILSIVDVPFLSGPNRAFVDVGCELLQENKDKTIKKYSYKPPSGSIRICRNIFVSLSEENLFNRPIVFLVSSPKYGAQSPHTGVYIYIPNGELYSVGYIYINFSEEFTSGALVDFEHQYGAFCSPDMPLQENRPSVILWFGLLTYQMFDRLEEEIKRVTEIRFRTERIPLTSGETLEVVGNNGKLQLNFVIPHRHYRDFNADYRLRHETTNYDQEPAYWNCRIWAIYILFGVSGLRYFWKDQQKEFGPSFDVRNHGNNRNISGLISDWWNAVKSDPDNKERSADMLFAMTIMNYIFMNGSEFNTEWTESINKGILNHAIYGNIANIGKDLLEVKLDFNDWEAQSRTGGRPGTGGRIQIKMSKVKGKSRKIRKSHKIRKSNLYS